MTDTEPSNSTAATPVAVPQQQQEEEEEEIVAEERETTAEKTTEVTSTTEEEEEEAPAKEKKAAPKKKKTVAPKEPAKPTKKIVKKLGVVRHGNRRNQPYVKSTEIKSLLLGITKPAIQRLARRGGLLRISKSFRFEVRKIVNVFMSMLMKNAVLYMGTRKTMMSRDVVHALELMGRPVYGVEKTSVLKSSN
jgi:histone H4